MKEFNGHYIRHNKSNLIPRRLVCFDTETSQKTISSDKTEQIFRLGVAVFKLSRGGKNKDTIQWLESDLQPELCDWIVSKCHNKERLYVFSANIWFDIRVSGMLQYLKKHHWKNKMLFVNGMSLILSFKKENKHIVFLNIQNYFRTSVKVMGDLLGLPKLDIDFVESSTQELYTYCKRDTEIIYHSMLNLFKFSKEHDLGCFGYTFPSLSFNAYRHRFMKHKLLVHKNDRVTALERESYFGARTECFKIGKFEGKKLVQVDINSMYPAVMKQELFPTRLAYHGVVCNLKALQYFIENGCCIARVVINTDEPVYPVKYNKKTVFPVGRFITTISTPEIKYALEHNHIESIQEYSYFKAEKIFEDYIDYFYNLRLQYKKDNNKPYEQLCKGLMNSLYGKFGQRVDETILDIDVDGDRMERYTELDADTGKFITTTYFFGRMIRTIAKQMEGRNSIVSIASHVTAYGRMMLWKYISKIGIKNLYYTDTDCFILQDKPSLLKLIPLSETELGYFKIEKRDNKIDIRGLKDYTFCNSVKIKGISKKAEQIGIDTYKQLFFPGINTELKEGIKENYTTRYVTKKLTREYTKGIVKKNGDVIPYTLALKS